MAVLMTDRRGQIVYWDDAARDLFGYTAEEAMGASLDLIVPVAFRARHWEGFRAAMDRGPSGSSGHAINFPAQRADGTILTCPARLVFLQDPAGQGVGVVGVFLPPTGGEEPFTPVSSAGTP